MERINKQSLSLNKHSFSLNKQSFSMNKEWHEANKMPKNPTLEQRIKWHTEHQKNCNCWPIPSKLLEKMKNRG